MISPACECMNGVIAMPPARRNAPKMMTRDAPYLSAIAPKMVWPICPPKPAKPPDAPSTELIADCASWSAAGERTDDVVRVPSAPITVVVVVAS